MESGINQLVIAEYQSRASTRNKRNKENTGRQANRLIPNQVRFFAYKKHPEFDIRELVSITPSPYFRAVFSKSNEYFQSPSEAIQRLKHQSSAMDKAV